MRYRADLDTVLKGVSFSVRSREKASQEAPQCLGWFANSLGPAGCRPGSASKRAPPGAERGRAWLLARVLPQVGVAGRTGCGKSTLFLALYRIGEFPLAQLAVSARSAACDGAVRRACHKAAPPGARTANSVVRSTLAWQWSRAAGASSSTESTSAPSGCGTCARASRWCRRCGRPSHALSARLLHAPGTGHSPGWLGLKGFLSAHS